MLYKEETLSRNDLNELIDKKIRTITRQAYDHNPFLHGLFESAGMNPHSDISGSSDLMKAYKKGVRTTGADIEKCYADYVSNVPTLEIWSSGSASKAKKILRSRDDLEKSVVEQERALISAGFLEGHKVLRFVAPPPYATGYSCSISAFFNNLMTRTLAFRVPHIPKNITAGEKEKLAKSFIDMIYEFNPDHVRGGVFPLWKFAQFMTSYGFDNERLNVKTAIVSSEPTTEKDREAIGKMWNAEPFDVYSSSELGNMSYECKLHSGMHVNEGDLFLTSVDPASGEEVGATEDGANLGTPLYEEGKLPGTFFINYSHGDKIAMLPDECSCGNRFKLSSHPRRDTKKKLLEGFGLDIKEETPLLSRAVRKMRRSLR